MGFSRRHVVPRLIELAMGQSQLGPLRECVLSAAGGRVLEISAGSGLNLLLYPASIRSVIGFAAKYSLHAYRTFTLSAKTSSIRCRTLKFSGESG
jgi:hypothetical protein